MTWDDEPNAPYIPAVQCSWAQTTPEGSPLTLVLGASGMCRLQARIGLCKCGCLCKRFFGYIDIDIDIVVRMCVLRSPKQKRLGIFSDRMPEFGNVMSAKGITMGPPDGPSFGSSTRAPGKPWIPRPSPRTIT